MIRRHPALCVVAAAYLAAIAVLCLTPNGLVERVAAALRRNAPWASANDLQLLLGVLLFLPVGVLLVLIVGRRGWFGVLVFGVIAACWLQLAAMVWLPDNANGTRTVVAHIAGIAVGAALAITALSMRGSAGRTLEPRAQHRP